MVLKRFLAVVLSALLFLSCLMPHISKAYNGVEMSMMGFEPSDNGRVWEDHFFFRRMEKRTGLRFRFTQFGDAGKYRAALDLLKTGEGFLPDVLFKARLTPADAMELYDAGVLVDLAPYLAQYAPAFFALLEKDPDLARAVTLPGGVIPALPHLSEIPAQNVLWINREWLDRLGLLLPATTEELRLALEAFRNGDPNRNGRADEIPLSFQGAYDLRYLAHAWGLAANDYYVFADGGSVRYQPLEDGFRPFIRWLKDAWDAGLLDNGAFSTVDAVRRQNDPKAANRLGAFFAPSPAHLVPVDWAGQYVALPPIPHEGKAVYRTISSPVFYGAFAVTSACADVGRALSWVDGLYAQEGAVLAAVGEEGTDYVTDGDRTWRLVREESGGDYLARAVISTDYSAPGISPDGFFRRYTDPMVKALGEEADKVAAVAKDPFPPFALSREQEDEIGPLQASLGRFVDESVARFVMGEWQTTDAQFMVFEAGLAERGVDKFLAFWQQIFDGGMGDAD